MLVVYRLTKTFPEGILIQIIMAFEIVEIGIINDILRTSWHVLEAVIASVLQQYTYTSCRRLLSTTQTLLQCIENVVANKVGIHTTVMKESTVSTHTHTHYTLLRFAITTYKYMMRLECTYLNV